MGVFDGCVAGKSAFDVLMKGIPATRSNVTREQFLRVLSFLKPATDELVSESKLSRNKAEPYDLWCCLCHKIIGGTCQNAMTHCQIVHLLLIPPEWRNGVSKKRKATAAAGSHQFRLLCQKPQLQLFMDSAVIENATLNMLSFGACGRISTSACGAFKLAFPATVASPKTRGPKWASRQIHLLHKLYLKRIVEEMKEAKCCAVAFDGWSSNQTMGYIAVMVSWIGADFHMRRGCLAHFRSSGGTAEEMAEDIAHVIVSHGLGTCVQGFTSDNAPTAFRAAGILAERFECAAQRCVSHGSELIGAAAFKKHDGIAAEGRKHMRKIAALLKQSNSSKEMLSEIQSRLTAANVAAGAGAAASGAGAGAAASGAGAGAPGAGVVEEVVAESHVDEWIYSEAGNALDLAKFAVLSDSDSDDSDDSGFQWEGVVIGEGFNGTLQAGEQRLAAVKRGKGRPRPKTIVQEVATRWSSILFLVRSILSNWDALSVLHADRQYCMKHKVFAAALDWWVANVRDVVLPLKDAMESVYHLTLSVSSELVPTLGRVLPAVATLREQLENAATVESGAKEAIEAMKEKLEFFFDGKKRKDRTPYRRLDSIVFAATILDPTFYPVPPTSSALPALPASLQRIIKARGINALRQRFRAELLEAALSLEEGASEEEEEVDVPMPATAGTDGWDTFFTDQFGTVAAEPPVTFDAELLKLHGAFQIYLKDFCKQRIQDHHGASSAAMAEASKRKLMAEVKAEADADPLHVYRVISSSKWQAANRSHVVHPALFTVARKILCVGASEANAERTFWISKRMVSALRGSLDPTTVEALVSLTRNMKCAQITDANTVYEDLQRLQSSGGKLW